MSERLVVFDLDGTLIDSDAALVAPFVALGVDPATITFGHVLADECARLGIDVDTYLDHYDPDLVEPFPGVTDLLEELDRWVVCSNKHPQFGHAELDRFGWAPELALFSDAFDGPKRLGPILEWSGLTGAEIVFGGDTAHDRRCANDVGALFGLAGWNPRSESAPGDVVLTRPIEVLALARA